MPIEKLTAPGARRARILHRDAFRCVYCGVTLRAADLTVDHVEPRVKGGDWSDGNLVACCVHCNRAKGGEPAWSYLACRPELRAHFLASTPFLWPGAVVILRRSADARRRRAPNRERRPRLRRAIEEAGRE